MTAPNNDNKNQTYGLWSRSTLDALSLNYRRPEANLMMGKCLHTCVSLFVVDLASHFPPRIKCLVFFTLKELQCEIV